MKNINFKNNKSIRKMFVNPFTWKLLTISNKKEHIQ